MSVVCCLFGVATLQTILSRGGYGGGTCLMQVVICQKISKLTHLDHVLEHLFVVSELEIHVQKVIRKH